jgi:hypothetical protein
VLSHLAISSIAIAPSIFFPFNKQQKWKYMEIHGNTTGIDPEEIANKSPWQTWLWPCGRAV